MLSAKFLKSSTLFRYSRYLFSSFTIKETTQQKPVGSKIIVQGWVQAVRKHKDVYFVDLIDGTCAKKLQIIIDSENESPAYGSSIRAEGLLTKSPHPAQEVELKVDHWEELGSCTQGYPFEYQQRYSPEYVRQLVHIRPRTRKFSSVLRIRNQSSMALHKFFQDEGFCLIHTPILTQNDCEGAGEVFSVTVQKDKLTEKSQSEVDFNEEFFGSPTHLTVSGQLHLEAMACALSRAYCFGPVFRAENSGTRRHASEFIMLEAEMAFIDNQEPLLQMIEKCIKSIIDTLLSTCSLEIDILSEKDNQLQKHLENMRLKPFVRMTYNDAIQLLQKCGTLKSPIKWGEDLHSEHERHLLQECGDTPVFVTGFPENLKPFYVKRDDQGMAQCFDLLGSFGGEICGGSMREERERVLQKHLPTNSSTLDWYVDLRRWGSVPHGGFGIGFDRLLQSLLCISNIRDIIPFPRRRRDCKC